MAKTTTYRTKIGNTKHPLAHLFHRKQCRQCGRPFLGRGSEWCSPDFCSKRCRMDAFNARRVEQRAKARKPFELQPCGYCERLFQPRRPTTRFCSVNCRVAAHRASQ